MVDRESRPGLSIPIAYKLGAPVRSVPDRAATLARVASPPMVRRWWRWWESAQGQVSLGLLVLACAVIDDARGSHVSSLLLALGGLVLTIGGWRRHRR